VDASYLAERGYVPSSQSWAAGQWGCGAFALALFLFIFLIGLLIFIYMLIVSPDGTLTVTYVRQAPDTRQQIEPAEATAPASLAERLEQLDAALEAGVITQEEHASKRSSILDDF
jgi:hypothetical protein